MLSGTKTTTVRTKRHGSPGDDFVVEGRTFRIEGVKLMPLHEACEKYWREEGMSSAEDFIETWRQNHPTRGFRPADAVWVHRFSLVPEAELDAASRG